MISIIKYFRENKINFTVSSTEPLNSYYDPYNAFNTEGWHFITVTSPYYWQVSFPRRVSIEKYQLGGGPGWVYYTTKFEVSYSNNGRDFVPVQNDTRKSPGTTYMFPIKTPIICKHFRLAMKETSGEARLNFYKFDCFGSVERISCDMRRMKAKLILNILTIILQSHTTS